MQNIVLALALCTAISLDASASRIYESLKIAVRLHQVRGAFERLVVANDAVEQKVKLLNDLKKKYQGLHIKRTTTSNPFLFDKLGSDMYHLGNRILDARKDLNGEEFAEISRAIRSLGIKYTKKESVLNATSVPLDDYNPIKKELGRSIVLCNQAEEPIVFYDTRRLL